MVEAWIRKLLRCDVALLSSYFFKKLKIIATRESPALLLGPFECLFPHLRPQLAGMRRFPPHPWVLCAACGAPPPAGSLFLSRAFSSHVRNGFEQVWLQESLRFPVEMMRGFWGAIMLFRYFFHGISEYPQVRLRNNWFYRRSSTLEFRWNSFFFFFKENFMLALG